MPNVVLFGGLNGLDQDGLWETNGTASGTFELASIAGANASGLSPSNLTFFNGQVLFEGKNSTGAVGLWTTDGTPAGTMEVSGIGG